jgi:hypothetical protein
VEGIFLLHNLPHDLSLFLSPMSFADQSSASILDTMKAIRKHWDIVNHQRVRDSWEKWFKMYAPKTDSALDYLAHLKDTGQVYPQPFRRLLFDKDQFLLCDRFSDKPLTDGFSLVDESFEWPEVFAKATNSVGNHFNRDPPPPRLYAVSSKKHMADIRIFETKAIPFYDTVLPNLTTTCLHKMISRRTTYSGEPLSTTGGLICIHFKIFTDYSYIHTYLHTYIYAYMHANTHAYLSIPTYTRT